MHPELENSRKEIWERPDEDGRKGRRPRSVGQKAKWEKPLADCIVATGVGVLGPGKQNIEAKRVERMTDGDVSHSSEIKLLSERTGVDLVWFVL
jgi:hypothetical protein